MARSVARALLLEGRVTAGTAAQLEDEWRSIAGWPGRLVADLSGVLYADEPGAKALAELRRHGVSLEGGSGFVRELIQEVSS